LGHYINCIGKDGDKAVETSVLLHEFGVSHEDFSPAVLACLPAADWRITEEIVNENGRKDLRHIPVVSIDPPGCKDIDDALHCVRLPNGNLEAGVHIAGDYFSYSSMNFVFIAKPIFYIL
jgi:exosome complex exonuclease DIS3/RRP44